MIRIIISDSTKIPYFRVERAPSVVFRHAVYRLYVRKHGRAFCASVFSLLLVVKRSREFCFSTLNIYENPRAPAGSVNDISWSPESGSKIVVSYYPELGTQPDYGNIAYIWQIGGCRKSRARKL